jgi:prepilin-type N-terminal cleavage/methylation domain-containing protein
MMKFNLRALLKKQTGFTLIELLVAIAITGIIALGASVCTVQLLKQTSIDRDFTIASRNAANAIYWVSHDAVMAQQIQGYTGFPSTNDLILGWTTWDSSAYSVTYKLENGTLKRICSDDGSINTMIVADHIDPGLDKTFCSFTDGVLTLTVTSSVGQGSKAVSITRKKEITSRPKL